MSELEDAFHKEMAGIYTKTVEAINYRPTQFLRMVNERGGLTTAHQLLAGDQVSDGFTKLWEHGRLDLSVEAVALKPEYAALFSADELDRARERLARANYTPLLFV